MSSMKTTTDAASELGIKRSKLDGILKKYPSFRPTATFQRSLIWTDGDIAKARKIVAFVEHGICPCCGRTPDGKAGDSLLEEEAADVA